MLYLILINILSFIIMIEDKRRAVSGQYRIPEKVLLFFAFIGGGIGALCGMRYSNHKTRKPMFYIGIPMLIVFNILVFLL